MLKTIQTFEHGENVSPVRTTLIYLNLVRIGFYAIVSYY